LIGLPLVKFKDSPTRKALIGPSQNLRRRIDLVIVMGFASHVDEAIFDRAGLGVQTHYLVAPRLISSLSFLFSHPNAEPAELVLINELDSGLFKCRLNSDQS